MASLIYVNMKPISLQVGRKLNLLNTFKKGTVKGVNIYKYHRFLENSRHFHYCTC